MKNTPYYTLFVLLLLIGSFACNRKTNGNKQEGDKKESTTTTTAADLLGVWVPSALDLTDKKTILPGKYYSLDIKSESIGLSLDINQCGSNSTIKKDSILIDKLMSCTEACCDAEAGIAIAKFLGGPLHYSITDGVLKLSHEKGVLTLFQPKNNLVGSSWEAVNYRALDSDGKSTAFTKPYILFFEPMNAILQLDVNSCSGGVSFMENAFEIKKGFGCSRKCCDSKDGTLLKDMLLGKNTYMIKEDKMIVSTTDSSIEFKKSTEKR
ncbi:MAG: hypothetical protein ACRBFS_21115 [Aureispira sp.]